MGRLVWEAWLRAKANGWDDFEVYMVGFCFGVIWMGIWTMICWWETKR